MKNKFTFLIVGMAVLASFIVVYEHRAESTSTPMEQLQASYMHVPSNLVIGQNVSALNIPLTRLSFSNTGGGNLPYDTRPISIVDHNVTLALYNGTTVNGTLIAEVVTNVGSQDVTMLQMGLDGAIMDRTEYRNIIQKQVIGCTQDQPFIEKITTSFRNGTTITKNVDTVVKCPQTADHVPTILKPGESFTVYVVGNMKNGSVPINKFGGGVDYAVGNSHEFGIRLPYATVN